MADKLWLTKPWDPEDTTKGNIEVYGPQELAMDTEITVKAEENPTDLDREAYIDVTTTGDNGVSKRVLITQYASSITWAYTLEVNPTNLSFSASPSTSNISITAKRTKYINGRKTDEVVTEGFDYVLGSNSSFLTVTKGTSGLTLSTSNNTTTSAKSTELTVSIKPTNIALYPVEGSLPSNITVKLSQAAGAKVYQVPVISTFKYDDSRDAAGGTLTPAIAVTQNYTWNGYGDAITDSYDFSSLKDTGAISASLATSVIGASVESSTAIVSWEPNVGTERSCTVNLTITLNGKASTSKSTTAKQNADAIDYYGPIEIKSFTVGTIPASGGTISSGNVSYLQVAYYISGRTVDITNGATISYSTEVTASSLGTTEKAKSKVGDLTVSVTLHGYTDTETVSVYQEANAITSYSDISLTTLTANDIPASGGTISTGGISASQTVSYTSGGTRVGDVSITFNTLSAETKGTTISNRTSVGTLTASASGEGGKTASKSITVYQAGNWVTSIQANGGTFRYPEIGAGATSASPSSIPNPTVTYTFSSGSTSTTAPSSTYGSLTWSRTYTLAAVQNGFTKVDSSTGVLTASNRGTDIGNSRVSGDVTLVSIPTWTPTTNYNSAGTKSGWHSRTTTCTQSGNYVTALTLSGGTLSYSNVTAAGGTVNPSTTNKTVTYTFSSGSTSNSAPSSTYGSYTTSTSYSIASVTGSSINTSTGAVTWSSRGTTTGTARQAQVTKTITATWTPTSSYNSAGTKTTSDTNTAYSTQNANAEKASFSEITASLSYSEKNAAAGTVNPAISYSQIWYYTSGSQGGTLTSGASISYSGSATGATLNTSTGVITWQANTGTRRSIAVTATITLNGKTTKPSATAYQSADAISSYGAVSVTFNDYGAKNAAAGTIDISATPTYSQVITYTSGATKTVTSGGSISYSGSATGATVNTSNGTVTWASNPSSSSRSVTVTATVTLNGKTGSDTATSTQNADAVSATTYGNVTAGTITNKTIPASGTTTAYTATAGNGSQVITYSWVSGKANTSETKTITPSVASISATAGSKGTTVSSVTTVKSQAVTWSGYGSKSASGTMYIYQAANTASYGAVSVSSHGSASDIPASGGSSKGSGGTGTQTITYTSGSTRAGTVTCGTYSTVTASSKGTTISNTTTAGTSSATLTGEGSKTATVSVTIYQAGNYVTALSQSIAATTGGYYMKFDTDVPAGGGWVNPTYLGASTITFTFSSGSTSTTTPSSTYGSLSSRSNYFYWDPKSYSSADLNSSTGAYYAPSLGTTVKDRTKLGNIVWKPSYTWTPTSSYNAAGTKSVTNTITSASYPCQAANAFSTRTAVYDGTISVGTPTCTKTSFSSSGGTGTLSATCTQAGRYKYTYTSGSTSYDSYTLSTNRTPTFSFSGTHTGFSISGTTLTVASNSGNARSAKIYASYGGTNSGNLTVSQAAGTIIVTMSTQVIEDTYYYPLYINGSDSSYPITITDSSETITLGGLRALVVEGSIESTLLYIDFTSSSNFELYIDGMGSNIEMYMSPSAYINTNQSWRLKFTTPEIRTVNQCMGEFIELSIVDTTNGATKYINLLFHE